MNLATAVSADQIIIATGEATDDGTLSDAVEKAMEDLKGQAEELGPDLSAFAIVGVEHSVALRTPEPPREIGGGRMATFKHDDGIFTVVVVAQRKAAPAKVTGF